MAQFLTEQQSKYLSLSTEIDVLYYSGQSDFQKIEIAHSKEFGNMLSLDGVFQTSEKTQFVYHDMIAHVPLYLHPSPERVLIIGGGDGGAARECVRHSKVKEVTMVEIDGMVVELAKKYLPIQAKAMLEKNPKLNVIIGDGLKHIAEKEDYYDVVIVDCSDPIGPGEGLFTEAFYKDTYKALKKNGIFVQQTESPFMHQTLIKDVFTVVEKVFPITRLYTAYIPLYPSGMHCFTLGSKVYDPLTWEPNRPEEFDTEYYNYGIQKAAFVLPTFVKRFLGK